MSKSKNLYIKTFGCQMNVYDSERMATSLGADGYNEVSSPEEADMILLNTCHIREKAAEKRCGSEARWVQRDELVRKHAFVQPQQSRHIHPPR